MSAADSLAELLAAAAEAGAKRALEQVMTPTLSRWIPLKESPLGYRPTLDLIRTGELRLHGIGHRRYVDREAVDSWMLAHPLEQASTNTPETDELDAICEFNRKRRSRRKSGGK